MLWKRAKIYKKDYYNFNVKKLGVFDVAIHERHLMLFNIKFCITIKIFKFVNTIQPVLKTWYANSYQCSKFQFNIKVQWLKVCGINFYSEIYLPAQTSIKFYGRSRLSRNIDYSRRIENFRYELNN